MFKWVQGRQNTGYWKMRLLFSKAFKFDMYLLKFEEGVHVPKHLDHSKDGKHYRLNIPFGKAEGGITEFENPPIYQNRFFYLFRSDINPHWMTKVEKGTRYMLSFGKII